MFVDEPTEKQWRNKNVFNEELETAVKKSTEVKILKKM